MRLVTCAILISLAGCSTLDLINAASSNRYYDLAKDQSYGNEPRQRVDVYLPTAKTADAPIVVFFYGGGWRDGSKDDYEFVASSLAREGIAVFIPDYRLYPSVVFPVFVQDGAKAVAWVLESADDYGLEAKQVYLMGHSAGAHIAALLATDFRYLETEGVGSASLAGLIGLSGPYDFLPLELDRLRRIFPEAIRQDSQPVNFVSAKSPPTLLIHGGDDEVVLKENSVSLAMQLETAGVPAEHIIYKGVGHARVVAALAPPLKFLAKTAKDSLRFIREVEAKNNAAATTP